MSNNDFQQASRYINIDILSVIGTPQYVQFQDEFICISSGIDILSPNMTLDVFCFNTNANTKQSDFMLIMNFIFNCIKYKWRICSFAFI